MHGGGTGTARNRPGACRDAASAGHARAPGVGPASQARAPDACSGAPRGRARRDALTGVVVQDLAGGGRAALACAALVRKVAVYAGRLAVLLPGDLLVYAALPGSRPRSPDPGADPAASTTEPGHGRRPGARARAGAAARRAGDAATAAAAGGAGGTALRYTLAARIAGRLECNLLVATDRHLVLCQAREGRVPGLPRPVRCASASGDRRARAQGRRGRSTRAGGVRARSADAAWCAAGRRWAARPCAARACPPGAPAFWQEARTPCPPRRQQHQTTAM